LVVVPVVVPVPGLVLLPVAEVLLGVVLLPDDVVLLGEVVLPEVELLVVGGPLVVGDVVELGADVDVAVGAGQLVCGTPFLCRALAVVVPV